MASVLDQTSLALAFQGRPDLQAAIRQAASSPNYIELFNEISLHICSLSSPSSSEPTSKKRRLDDGLADRSVSTGGAVRDITSNGAPQNGSVAAASGKDPVLVEIKDISVVVPQRKKYTLCFTSSHLYARLPDSQDPVPGISYAWKDIEYVFCLPVPEKAQKQHNYILFPSSSNLPPARPAPGSPAPPEPIIFTISDVAPKPGTISGVDAASAAAVSDDYKTLFDWAISTRLKASGNNLKIINADPELFASVLRQAHRPGEKAVHVKAFRGSKDGYLFFLPNGILWGFKKPLLFLPHERIAAVSYTSVLQRTFNLSVEVDMSLAGRGGDDDDDEVKEEIEFSMVDQEDFAGIDVFVKRHGLQDRSMAEQRKAKRLNVNVVKDENGVVVGTAEAGELERAAKEAGQGDEEVDEEDEEEEDYDPGSEGESEGEGSSSEEEEESDGGGGGDDDGNNEAGDDDDDDDDDEEAENDGEDDVEEE